MGMSIDEIFAEVGELGRQQWKYLTLINILHIYFPFYMLQYTFVARNVDFYCNLNTSSPLDEVSSTLSENSLSSLGEIKSLIQLHFPQCSHPFPIPVYCHYLFCRNNLFLLGR